MMQRPAPGFSLVELLTALALGGLVIATAATVMQGQVRMARRISERTANGETVRIATQVLQAETRWLHALRDVRAFTSESLALRAVRGSGTICQVLLDGSAIAGLDGIRAPEPDKDSVLVLRDSIQESALPLLGAEPIEQGCGHGEHYRLRTSGSLLPGDVVLIFEPGSYHLSDRALRYHVGQAGRQPLTSESFDATGTFFLPSGSGGAAALRSYTAEPGHPSVRIRLPFLNGYR
jgi:prepilin-type N-terminal cleavage/methylation domain-containing protein